VIKTAYADLENPQLCRSAFSLLLKIFKSADDAPRVEIMTHLISISLRESLARLQESKHDYEKNILSEKTINLFTRPQALEICNHIVTQLKDNRPNIKGVKFYYSLLKLHLPLLIADERLNIVAQLPNCLENKLLYLFTAELNQRKNNEKVITEVVTNVTTLAADVIPIVHGYSYSRVNY
jgi:hypothetical protein